MALATRQWDSGPCRTSTSALPETPLLTCRVSARMTFVVSLAAELVVQVAASRSAGVAEDEQLEVRADDRPPLSIDELHGEHGATLHVIRAAPGRLTVDYRARVRLGTGPGSPCREASRPEAAATTSAIRSSGPVGTARAII